MVIFLTYLYYLISDLYNVLLKLYNLLKVKEIGINYTFQMC